MEPQLTLQRETIEIDGGRELYSFTFLEDEVGTGNLKEARLDGGEESL